MSTAFRNFIITFALAATLFAVVGYIVVDNVLDGMFKQEVVSEETVDYSYETPEDYYQGNTDISGDNSGDTPVVPSTEDFGEGYLVFFEDHTNQLLGAKFVCKSKNTSKMVYNEIPMDGTIMVNGYNRSFKQIYSSNGADFLSKKLQFVFGVPFKGYMVFDTKAMEELFVNTEILRDNNISVSCNIPYEIKYEDPEMEEFNKQNPENKVYITITGNNLIEKNNAKYIFNEIPDDAKDSANASAMFSEIYESVFNSIFSNKNIRDENATVGKFFGCFSKCTFNSENNLMLFKIFDGTVEVKQLPILSQMAGKELQWDKLPSSLEEALK
jgi:hypothetical protein